MNQQNNPARIRAKRLLKHYFFLIALRAGIELDRDSRTEIDDIVDDIITAAVDQINEVRQQDQNHAEFVENLRRERQE